MACLRPALASLLFASVLLVGSTASAAGPWLVETGGADMALAGAGRAALSLDASALAANPATLGRLEAIEVSAAVMPVVLDYEFRSEDGLVARATNEASPTVVPAVFAAVRRDRWTYAFGAYSSIGLAFDSGRTWGGQRAVEQAGLASFNVGPGVAWNANDRWSVGASLLAQWVRPELRLSVANDATYYGAPAGLPDGALRFAGDGWSAGGTVGVAARPRPGLRIGVSWTAPVSHEVPLAAAGNGLHPVLATLVPEDGATRLDFTVPQQWLVGIAHETRQGTLVSAGMSWQEWSRFGEATCRCPGGAMSLFPSGLRDTWGVSVGVRRPLGRGWAASTGIGYESSPAGAGGIPVYFPVAEQWRWAGGVERDLGDRMVVRGTLSLVLQGDAEVVQRAHPLPLPGIPEFRGAYRDTRVYLFALALGFRP